MLRYCKLAVVALFTLVQGLPLQDTLTWRGQTHELPPVVEHTLSYLEKHGIPPSVEVFADCAAMDCEGLFRLSGSAPALQALKESYDRG